MDQKKISVVIPNYNGAKLLRQNLPYVVKIFPREEIIVVDDGSEDESVILLKNHFKKVKTLVRGKNAGFATAANEGVRKSSGDLILLLNTDVLVSLSTLNLDLIKDYFKKEDTFAIALADYSHEDSKVVVRGRAGGDFKKGFLVHWKATPKRGETLWASGGASFFDREKFLNLGGFDEDYNPFYWEDIDLSFRAIKKGWKVYFEPKAQVNHYHKKGVIIQEFSQFRIKTTAYRNQFLFVWKNISDTIFVLSHLFYLPYHLLRAFFKKDFAFIFGFFLAIAKSPKLLFKNLIIFDQCEMKDREIFQKFKNVK